MSELNPKPVKDTSAWTILDVYEIDGIYNTSVSTYLELPKCEFCNSRSVFRMVRRSNITDNVYHHHVCSKHSKP
jgi:hypothetical protein